MKLPRSWSATACAALLSLACPVRAVDLSASGTVFGTDGNPLSDVTVSLALAGTRATTDASGAWRLTAEPVGIASRTAAPVAGGRLALEDGHLSVRFDGRDVSGRGKGRVAAAPRSLVGAARAADVPDTLLYSWNGKVRLRDTISVSRTGIVRTLDTALNPAIVYGYLTDERDGRTYRTVAIGSQVWMAQNLNFAADSSFCYEGDTTVCAKYGRLYKWAAAMALGDSCNAKTCTSQVALGRQGACPGGWHVPSDAEWAKLTDTTLASTTAGTKLKARSPLWYVNTGTDDYGFTVLPAGDRNYNGSFYYIGKSAYLWAAPESKGNLGWARDFDYGNENVYGYFVNKSFGFSLRCLQD